MNAFSTLAAGAVARIWKIAAILLLVVLLLLLSAGGTGWWMLTRARDEALTNLVAEKKVSEDLRTGIREQNRAVEALAAGKAIADARGAAAQQVAAANGKRLDLVLTQTRTAVATTCDQAMPAVNLVLEGIR